MNAHSKPSKTPSTVNAPPTFQCTLETQQLAEYLANQAATIDCERVLTYAELSAAAGCDVRTKRHILQSARNIALRTARVWFTCIPNAGLRKLSDHELSGEGEDGRHAMLRLARRKLARMACARFDELTAEQKTQHNMTASLLGAIHVMNRKPSLDRLRLAVTETQAKIPVGHVMALFANPTNGSQ